MAIHFVQDNGNAPANAKIGDTVRTAGGNYEIVAPNTPGATYNDKSGFWSVRADVSPLSNSAINVVELNNSNYQSAANLANAISQQSSAQQYKFNADEAEKSRNWQENMSNTAHQREVKDLIAAGLNPVLSANLGGASTPSGATASGSSFSGQKADVDTQYLGAMLSLYQTIMNNETTRDVARINQQTALETAKISSAASMYNANKQYQSNAENSNFINRIGNAFTSGNSGKTISNSEKSLQAILDMFKPVNAY